MSSRRQRNQASSNPDDYSFTLSASISWHDRETLRRLGVQFGPPVKGRDGQLVHVNLPEGWAIVSYDDLLTHYLVDPQGRRRAVEHLSSHHQQGHRLVVLCRFTCRAYTDTTTHTFYYEAADCDKVLFRQQYRLSSRTERRQARRRVTAWLDHNYPRWKNPETYWR